MYSKLVQWTRHHAFVFAWASLVFCWSSTYAAEVRGTVRDEGGFPLPGAAVTVKALSDSGGTYSGSAARDGSFVITGVPFGTYSLEATLSGFVGVCYKPVEISAPVFQWHFRLPLGPTSEGGVHAVARVIGTLRIGTSRCGGATVCLTNAARRHCTTANELGEYEVAIDPGRYAVQVRLVDRVLWNQQLNLPEAGEYRDVIKP